MYTLPSPEPRFCLECEFRTCRWRLPAGTWRSRAQMQKLAPPIFEHFARIVDRLFDRDFPEQVATQLPGQGHPLLRRHHALMLRQVPLVSDQNLARLEINSHFQVSVAGNRAHVKTLVHHQLGVNSV